MSSGVTAPSRLVLGSAQWGQQYGIANRSGAPGWAELEQILSTGLRAGVRTIDTARAYGRSEELIGQLASDPKRWEVVTKLAGDVAAPDRSQAHALEGAERSLETSRAALRRERLDVVLLHRAGHRVVHGGAIWRLLIEQRALGTIGQIGVSADSPDEAVELLDDPDLDAIQVATSLLDQRLVRAGFFERAAKRAVRVFVRSIFLQGVGLLSIDQLPPQLAELGPVLGSIRAWAAEHDQPIAWPYLHFARTLPAEVVIGVERHEQLADDIRAWRQGAHFAEALRSLAESIPDLPADLLTPSRWPEVALRS